MENHHYWRYTMTQMVGFFHWTMSAKRRTEVQHDWAAFEIAKGADLLQNKKKHQSIKGLLATIVP